MNIVDLNLYGSYLVVKFSIGLYDRSRWCKRISVSNTPLGTSLMLLWLNESEVKESSPSKAPGCTSWIWLKDSVMAIKLVNSLKACGRTSVIVWPWSSNPSIDFDSFINSGHLNSKSKGMIPIVCSSHETMSFSSLHGQSTSEAFEIGSKIHKTKSEKKLFNSILSLISISVDNYLD